MGVMSLARTLQSGRGYRSDQIELFPSAEDEIVNLELGDCLAPTANDGDVLVDLDP